MTVVRREMQDVASVAVVSAGMAALFLIVTLRQAFPLDFAGLYTLMAEGVARNRFHLPHTVAYYGPGGIPFAYPPLGFFVMAFFTYVWHVPTWTYLRVAPVIFSCLALMPYYLLARRILASHAMALIAVVYMATSTNLFRLHTEAGGSVRALGFLFALAALACTYRAMARPVRSVTLILLAAASCALTILSHPAYALFVLASVAAFVCAGPRDTRVPFRFTVALAVVGGGILGAIPWWGTIIAQDGVGIFRTVAASQSGLAHHLLSELSYWESTIRHPVGVVTIIHLAQLGALISCLARRKYFFPVWFGIVSLAGDGDGRFLQDTIGSMLIGLIIVELMTVLTASLTLKDSQRIIARRLVGAASLVYPLLILVHWLPRQQPGLTAADVAASAWLRTRSPASSDFLVLTDSSKAETAGEWFPYLSRRTAVGAPWGAEWNGQYVKQERILWTTATCVQRVSVTCIDALRRQEGTSGHPFYLVVREATIAPSWPTLLASDPTWRRVFHHDGDSIWEAIS